jgi:hypothetical protein
MRAFSAQLRCFVGMYLPAAGLAIVALASIANAQPAAKREPQHASDMQIRECLHVLQATKRMLESADHDYGGHRVDAIKAMNAAERQLILALETRHKRGAGAGKGARASSRTGKGGKRPEPQRISNLQLADAIKIVEKTRVILEKGDHDYGGHRAAAVRDLGVVVRQLKTALNFEKKK